MNDPLDCFTRLHAAVEEEARRLLHTVGAQRLLQANARELHRLNEIAQTTGITIRVTAEEMAQVRAKADAAGKTVGAWVHEELLR